VTQDEIIRMTFGRRGPKAPVRWASPLRRSVTRFLLLPVATIDQLRKR
jgi:hypothetical protein